MAQTLPNPQNVQQLTLKFLKVTRIFLATPFVENEERKIKISKNRFYVNLFFFLAVNILGHITMLTSLPFSQLQENPYMLLSSMRLYFSAIAVFVTSLLIHIHFKNILNILNRLLETNYDLTVKKRSLKILALCLFMYFAFIVGGTMWHTAGRLFQKEYSTTLHKYLGPLIPVYSILSRDSQELLIFYMLIIIISYLNAVHDKLNKAKRKREPRTSTFLLPEILAAK